MPSTRKSDVAMNTIKRPQSLKAKKCSKESNTGRMKVHKSGQCQTVVKNPDGPMRTIIEDFPNDQLKNSVVSSPACERKINIIDNQILVHGPSKDVSKTQNDKLIICTPSTIPETRNSDQIKIEPALQKIQIVRGRNNKIIVSGLHPNQRLIKLPNGKLHVLNVSPVPVTYTEPMLQPSALKTPLNLTPNVAQPDQKSNVRPEPLTESQLLEAMSYLIRKDTGFVKKLHEAYLKSFADRAS